MSLSYSLATFLTGSDKTGAAQINDRYEFPDELDLDLEGGKWLSENADRSVRNLYKLHSVLVHSGGVHGGHYYAYIQPDRKRWLKFDDERVGFCSPQSASHESGCYIAPVLRAPVGIVACSSLVQTECYHVQVLLVESSC